MPNRLTRAASRGTLLLALAAAALAAPAAVRAQAPAASAGAPAAKLPNYSGTWEMNAKASDFGPQPAPSKLSVKVEQTGDKLTATQSSSSAMGDLTTTTRHVIGGPASTDTVNAGGESVASTSTARWDGSTLVIDSKVQRMGMEIPVVSRWTLSPDGRTLTIDRHIMTPMGELTQHVVYDKKA